MKNLLFIAITLGLLSSCIESRECRETSGYKFVIPAALSPANRVFRVGDTITVSSTFSDVVYDRSTDREHLLEDFLFYPGAVFGRLDTVGIDTIELISTKHFDILIDPEVDLETINSSEGLFTFGQYAYNDNIYSLEYKFVCKHPGLYYTFFNFSLEIFGWDQDFPSKCTFNTFDETITILNDGAQNNADLLLEAVDTGWHRVYNYRLESKFFDTGGYCFRVEE